jgi:hypothetical protein
MVRLLLKGFWQEEEREARGSEKKPFLIAIS